MQLIPRWKDKLTALADFINPETYHIVTVESHITKCKTGKMLHNISGSQFPFKSRSRSKFKDFLASGWFFRCRHIVGIPAVLLGAHECAPLVMGEGSVIPVVPSVSAALHGLNLSLSPWLSVIDSRYYYSGTLHIIFALTGICLQRYHCPHVKRKNLKVKGI